MACIKPCENFDPAQDSKALEKAMKGFGTDERAIINILAYRSSSQRREIESTYKAQFGKDLLKELSRELSGKFKQAVLWSFGDRAHVNAHALFKAIDGAGTNESMLIDVLCTATNEEILEIEDAYLDGKGRTLESDIKGDTSGDFQQVLIALLQASREKTCNDNQAKEDSFELFQAGEAKRGTDEGTFTRILCTRSWEQLRRINQIYSENYGHDVIEAISRETSGDYKAALTKIMQSAINIENTIVEMLYKSMKGMGTNDDSLIRIILAHSECNLARMRDKFNSKYDKSLSEMIKGDTSGDYRRFLLAIVEQSAS